MTQPALLVAATTDVGRHRSHNEDTFLVCPDLGLYAVADGMGGHEAGDVASNLAATVVNEFFESTETGFESDPDDMLLPAPAQRLAAAIRKANAEVHGRSVEQHQLRGMGSTIVALHIPTDTETAYVAHVGDSRCYRIRGEVIEQLTRDHSLLNEALAIDPNLSETELARLPTNIITRALGMAATVEVDLRTIPTDPGDHFLLCSDGLSGLVSESEMAAALMLADDLEEAAELLVALANDAGGIDNITALVVGLQAV